MEIVSILASYYFNTIINGNVFLSLFLKFSVLVDASTMF